MLNQKIREKICELGYKDSMLFDWPSFDNSILGVTIGGNVVYDYMLMADEFAKESKQEKDVIESGIDEDELIIEAMEFIDYNTLGALASCSGVKPIVLCESAEDGGLYNVLTGETFSEKILSVNQEETSEL